MIRNIKRVAMLDLTALVVVVAPMAVKAGAGDVFDAGGSRYMVLEQAEGDAPAVKMCSPTAEGREYTLPLDADGGLTVPSQVSNDGVDYAVVEIEAGTFYRDPSIISVMLPASLKKIDGEIFCYCENLREIDLSAVKDVDWVDIGMVELPSLKVLRTPSVKENGSFCSFNGDYNLDKLTFSEKYGDYCRFLMCFSGIESVKEIYCMSAQPPYFDSGIDGVSSDDGLDEYWLWFGSSFMWENQPVIYVPIGAAEAYRNSGSWHIYNDIREVDFASVDAVDEDSAADRLTFSGGSIVAPDGEAVTVYDLSGRMVANADLAQGIYVVRVGDRCVKFAVRR